jgi:hypothetical protein
MSSTFQDNSFDAQPPDIALHTLPLPAWLARRLLRPGEQVTWVRGPRWNPTWECYITHPGLFLAALAIGGALLAAGRLIAGSWSDLPAPTVLAAAVLVFGAVYVLAIANAYFTRLVVTDLRLVIMQGYEVCRSWALDDLPQALVRYDMRRTGQSRRSVDLTALQTMLGGSTDQFVEGKTIRALSKHLDQIKAREKGRS